MFLIDDLLFSPVTGIMAVFREIYNAAQQDTTNQAQTIRNELSELYMLLETGQISEADFDRHEKKLLDQLDDIEKRSAESDENMDDGEDDGDEDDDGEDDDDDDDDNGDVEDPLEDDESEGMATPAREFEGDA